MTSISKQFKIFRLYKSLLALVVVTILIDSIDHSLLKNSQLICQARADNDDGTDGSEGSYVDGTEEDGSTGGAQATGGSSDVPTNINSESTSNDNGESSAPSSEDDDDATATLRQQNFRSSNGNNNDNDEFAATTSAFQAPMAATRQPVSFFSGPPQSQSPYRQHPQHHHHHTPPPEMRNFFDTAFGPTLMGPTNVASNDPDPAIGPVDDAGSSQNHHAAMNALFQRRQLSNQLQAGQELNPLTLGIPGSPQSTPFNVFGSGGTHPKASSNNLDSGLGPALPFGLGGLPGIPGFHTPFDGPQRGDHSAHSNLQSMPAADNTGGGPSLATSGAKTWPKIFRFTDGRINLSDFEKQKKIRLNSKNLNNHHLENQIDSSPVIFDGRPLRRKSFLILHGGIY